MKEGFDDAEDDVADAVKSAAYSLKQLGVTVEEFSFPQLDQCQYSLHKPAHAEHVATRKVSPGETVPQAHDYCPPGLYHWYTRRKSPTVLIYNVVRTWLRRRF